MRAILFAAIVLALGGEARAEDAADAPSAEVFNFAKSYAITGLEECVSKAAAELNRSCEPASDVAAAAVFECRDYVEMLRGLAVEQGGEKLGKDVADLASSRSTTAALSQIVAARAIARCDEPMPAPPEKYTLHDPNGYTSIDLRPPKPKAVSAWDVFGASWRQDSVLGAMLSRHSAGGERDPAFDFWKFIEGTRYEKYGAHFGWDAWNLAQGEALKRQIDMELEDAETMAAGDR